MSITNPTLAEITMFAGNFAPRNWEYCNGQLLPINDFQALFSLLGTTYGGDGRTSFGLPDLRGRVPLHTGGSTGPGLPTYRLGEKSGQPSKTLNVLEIPSHNHNVTASTQMRAESRAGNSDDPTGRMLASGGSQFRTNVAAEDVVMDPAMVQTDVQQNNVGGNQAFSLMNPYLGLNFIIAVIGTFPSRS